MLDQDSARVPTETILYLLQQKVVKVQNPKQKDETMENKNNFAFHRPFRTRQKFDLPGRHYMRS